MSQFTVRDMSLPTISTLKRSELRTMLRFTSRHFPMGEERKKVLSDGRRLIRVAFGTNISALPEKNFVEAYGLIRAYCEAILGRPLPEDACLRGIAANHEGLRRLAGEEAEYALTPCSDCSRGENASGEISGVKGATGASGAKASEEFKSARESLREFQAQRKEDAAAAAEKVKRKPRGRSLTKEERIASAAAYVAERMLKAKLYGKKPKSQRKWRGEKPKAATKT